MERKLLKGTRFKSADRLASRQTSQIKLEGDVIDRHSSPHRSSGGPPTAICQKSWAALKGKPSCGGHPSPAASVAALAQAHCFLLRGEALRGRKAANVWGVCLPIGDAQVSASRAPAARGLLPGAGAPRFGCAVHSGRNLRASRDTA